jgi:catechol-2,3-dioxygenase
MTPPRPGPVFLVTERLDELARFYEHVIGLEPASSEPGHNIWYRAGDLDFVLHAPRSEPGPEFTPHLGHFPWFLREIDLDRLASELEEAGSSCWGPYESRGRRLLIALDPDGNMVGIAAERTASRA